MPFTDIADPASSARRLAVAACAGRLSRRAAPVRPAWRTTRECSGFGLIDV